MFNEVEINNDTLNILCWGVLTEQAIFTKHCISTGRQEILDKVRFISHWTSSSFHVGTLAKPDSVHNCFNDGNACTYMKNMAKQGKITFYDCGAIGQYGIVEGSPKGAEYYKQFEQSELGKIYTKGKYIPWEKTVDDSDCATYWVLLGNMGVGLNDILPNGTNPPEIEKKNEEIFFKNAAKIRDEIQNRTQIMAESF